MSQRRHRVADASPDSPDSQTTRLSRRPGPPKGPDAAQYYRKSCRATRDSWRWAALAVVDHGVHATARCQRERSAVGQCQRHTARQQGRARLASSGLVLFLTLEFASLSGRGAGLAVAGEKRAGWSSDPAGRIHANRIGQAFRHRLIGTCSVLFIARPSPWALGRKREFRGPKPASRIDEDPFPGGLVIAMLLHGRRVSTCMISLEPSAALHSACASKRPKLSTKTTTPTGSLLARWLVCTHTHRQVAGRRSPARQHGIRAARHKTLNSQGRASDAELGRIRWVQNRRSPPAQEGRSGVMPLRSSKDPGSCSLGTAPARTMARIRGRFLLCCSLSAYLQRTEPRFESRTAERQSGRAAGRELAEHRIGNEGETDPKGTNVRGQRPRTTSFPFPEKPQKKFRG